MVWVGDVTEIKTELVRRDRGMTELERIKNIGHTRP